MFRAMTSSAGDEEVVVDYHDSLLRLSDVRLLNDGQWLNDAIIGFAYEYFENEIFAEHSEILFVNPVVVQLLKLGTDADAVALLDSIGIASKQLVLLPINDHGDAETVGGSHWSLLVWDRRDHALLHYDSSLGKGAPTGVGVREILDRLLRCCKGDKVPTVKAGAASHQINGFDCGVYVIAHSEKVVECWLHKQSLDCSGLSPAFITEKRRKLRDVIRSLHTS